MRSRKGFLLQIFFGAIKYCITHFQFKNMAFQKKKLSLLFYAIFTYTALVAQNAPQTNISNGEIDATIYLPDPNTGYYRGVRFDWSGVVPRLRFKGHDYFGKWFKTYDSKSHDAIMGPVEAFDPLGYQDAQVLGLFTKVGVGVLEKRESTDYHFSKAYKIRDGGEWEIAKDKDEVSFTHTLNTGDYPYIYIKTIRLENNKMIIEHELTNTGKNGIDTKVYNHNFFVIDNDPIGPGYSIELAFDITGDTSGLRQFAVADGNKIRYVKPLGEKDYQYVGDMVGFGSTFDEYLFRIENRNTGAGVKFSCDRPLSKLVFWSMNKTLCPEPYIDIKVEPGKSFTWTIVYEFYTL